MNPEPRMAIQPSLNLRMLVSRIVIRNQMDLRALRGLSVNELQELYPLLMAVPRHTGPDHLPVQRIECSEQSRRSVALIVVGHRAVAARHKGKARLGSVERLNLAFFIDRENQSVLWRVQVKPDDIIQLLHELRIPAQF